MDLVTLARAQQARQRALAARVAALAAARWALLGADDPGGAWMGLVPELVAAVVIAQRAAAAGGAEYAARAADQLAAGDADGAVQPGQLAGVASDGRPLDSLLFLPMLAAKARLSAGMALDDALPVGGTHLTRIVATQVYDAGRVATGVGIAARPKLGGYVRQIVGATCARCIVLSGRVYRWSEGFARHPHCDCIHVPFAQGAHVPEPREVFDGMSAAEQDAVFGKAGARAVRDGADLGKVVNAGRGVYTAGGRRLTTEGVRARHGNVRLMPEQIYREAGEDRGEALRLLRRFGYIT